ncbi:hypothetical protein AB0F43_12345 [Kribbella sp. NPDC023972]|uniref:hypothetical protein n=1 Tax=Kribbella sp. NPDC023972 TaxID=3154795 RepID=UPI0033C80CFE
MFDDPDGNLVYAGDLAVQARQVFGNLGRAMAARSPTRSSGSASMASDTAASTCS